MKVRAPINVEQTPVTLLLTPEQAGVLYAAVEEARLPWRLRAELLKKLRDAWQCAEAARALLRGRRCDG